MANYVPCMPLRTPALPVLPYRKPTRGRDYWVLDDVLPDPDVVRERCLARSDWTEGYPHKPESWPGLRTMPALEPGELTPVEKLVRRATGAPKIWAEHPAGGGTVNHNCVQVVGEGVRIPHRANRLLLYSANLIHTATRYWGTTLLEKRMTAVFFWMA